MNMSWIHIPALPIMPAFKSPKTILAERKQRKEAIQLLLEERRKNMQRENQYMRFVCAVNRAASETGAISYEQVLQFNNLIKDEENKDD